MARARIQSSFFSDAPSSAWEERPRDFGASTQLRKSSVRGSMIFCMEKTISCLPEFSVRKAKLKDVNSRQALERIPEKSLQSVRAAPSRPPSNHYKVELQEEEHDEQGTPYKLHFVPCASGFCGVQAGFGRSTCLGLTKEKGDDIRNIIGTPPREPKEDALSKRMKLQMLKQYGWVKYYACTKNHSEILRDKVYATKCKSVGTRMNSAVRDLLTNSLPCFCCLERVSFRNFLLGDRGVSAVVPLFKFGRGLRSVNLSGNNLREKGLKIVLHALKVPGRLPELRMLDLSHNPIGFHKDLIDFLDKKLDVLLLGVFATEMSSLRREQVHRRTMCNFLEAPVKEQLRAWRLGRYVDDFADRDAWVKCTPIVQAEHGTSIWHEEDDDCFHEYGLGAEAWQVPMPDTQDGENSNDDDHDFTWLLEA